MFFAFLMCLALGLVSFIHDSVSWQMPLWASFTLTGLGAVGLLSSRLRATNGVQK